MHEWLRRDRDGLVPLLTAAADLARRFLGEVDERPVGLAPTTHEPLALPETGVGGATALATFTDRYYPELTASAGPRSFGYVVGGATPAAIVGDWLTAAFDQDNGEGVTAHLEIETIHMLRELFALPGEQSGVFVSGATMANAAGLATARQWLGRQRGIDVAQAGTHALGPVRVYSGAPHSSIHKALAMLGIGRSSVRTLPCLPGTEAVDPEALASELRANTSVPAIIVGNAGTVNTTSFDDLVALARLRDEHGAWLHVDGAFGLFAACSPRYATLVRGVGGADSVAVDLHKWLNVPYDSGVLFTRHAELQRQVFINSHAAYLRDASDVVDFMNRTPETSRRLRALPAWMTLMAYGRSGYREIVERDCALARHLASLVERSGTFELLAPCTLNVVCFALRAHPERTSTLLDRLTRHGGAFLTSTVHHGRRAIRAALCNWRTSRRDVDVAWEALLACV